MSEQDDANKRKKTAFRYSVSADIDLLKEVVMVAPYDAPYGQTSARWEEICDHMRQLHGDSLTTASCRKRFDDLLSAFKKSTLKALRASGTEEEYVERDQLMQDISDMMDVALLRKKAAKQVQERRESDGHLIREAALMSMKRKAAQNDFDHTQAESPPAKLMDNQKSSRQATVRESTSFVASFTLMMEESNRIKAEEIAMKREEIALEQRKLELEQASTIEMMKAMRN
ncbi:hypothetical protein, variant [Aphanomyces invadans]|uniref:Myb-like domain-containing protein n=1 Tax=Aphanomyces invadans TaxID=157072 RepID=A0A024UKW4_9STRA|nr:hypothetical protein, variant [Aphanomyces invadans]ETW06268.1 hypothetical protein, variant [Aphanomyces invadans]|eukprot:XP_008864343.1 hypothetical protein, variant [Aphanomyces invadans]